LRISDPIEAKKMKRPPLEDRKVQRHTLPPDRADGSTELRIGYGLWIPGIAEKREDRRQIAPDVRKFSADILWNIGMEFVEFDMLQALN
jgi:hypothetical protein